MHRVSLCLVTLFVCAACSLLEPKTTIQVQGTVTAADDGSPIVGASVHVGKFNRDQSTQVLTNNQGDYSLSFIDTACSESFFLISASADGFQSVAFSGFQNDPNRVRCANEPQTIDFQLERETT